MGTTEPNDNSKKTNGILKDISLESIIAVYRNLRENYEYNLRYSKAGQFFIREMELQRKYSQIKLKKLKKKKDNETTDKKIKLKKYVRLQMKKIIVRLQLKTIIGLSGTFL